MTFLVLLVRCLVLGLALGLAIACRAQVRRLHRERELAEAVDALERAESCYAVATADTHYRPVLATQVVLLKARVETLRYQLSKP